MKLYLIPLLLLAIGCGSTSVTGGQQQRESRAVKVSIVTPDGTFTHYEGDNDRLSTTQPSATSNTGALPKIGHADEGEIGSVGFTQAKKNFANAWPLALLFVAGAAVNWFVFKNAFTALICVGCAILALLWPFALIFGAVVMLCYCGWEAYQDRKAARQLVQGSQAALSVIPEDDRKQAKLAMEAKHDVSTKRIVAKVKTAI